MAVVCVWIPAVLWVDRTASVATQVVLGVVTWALLIALLVRAPALLRVQTLVVVAFATLVEYVFSGWLGVYEYRLDHVPAYVPPGHGLVYLAALGFAAWVGVRARLARVAVVATIVLGALAASWGLWISPRPDLLGAFWYLCLVGFLVWGRSRMLYVGAFIVVTWLEVLGTMWGVWRWMPRDTILGIVTIGNPPSVAAGGYGWFDLAAVSLAPVLLSWGANWWSRRPSLRPKKLHHAVMNEAVGAQAADDAGAGVRRRSVVAGASTTGLDDDRNQGGDVPRIELGLSGDVDRPLGHQQVRPEVAVGTAAPAPVEEGLQAVRAVDA